MRDLNKELRQKRREKKPACLHTHWEDRSQHRSVKQRYDKCHGCSELFPCRGECCHFDCSEARIARGMDFDYQDGCHELNVTYMDGTTNRILFEAADV
jgi:hypothetical protein